MKTLTMVLFILSSVSLSCTFWDVGTSTVPPERIDKIGRISFFRWQRAESTRHKFLKPGVDWNDNNNRFRLCVVAGISIDMKPLSTAVMLNKRILITAANYLEPYMNRQMDLRIWALGRAGLHTTPYRYRVWRIWRLFPKSNNPEHLHGPRGEHCPRHDVSLIISRDPIYIYYVYPFSWQYPHRAWLIDPHTPIVGTETEDQDNLLFVGSGFEYLEHVRENYKIYFALPKVEHIVDCSKYLPKHWGKFICFRNVHHYSGVQNGGGLFLGKHVIGIGSFEIRVNEDRILVFTDLRYYTNIIRKYASIHPGQYYEYAHSEWFAYQSYFILGWDRQNSLKRLPIHYADGKNVGNVYTLG